MTTLTEQQKISDGATVGSHEDIIVAVLKKVLPQTRLANQMSATTLANQQMVMARAVRLYRNYAEGKHRSDMSDEMRKMLNIKDTIVDAGTMPFNINYCPKVIDALNDRLQLKTIEVNFTTEKTDGGDGGEDTDKKKAQQWSDNLYRDLRIDGMQHSLHEAAIRDGNTYLLIDVADDDDGEKQVRFTHELSYDTNEGVMVFYETNSSPTPAFAMKLWSILGTEDSETVKVNVYWPDKIQKFVSDQGGLEDLPEESLIDKKTDKPLGVPIVHFPNRGKPYGRSEIRDVVGLQDVVNRNLASMTVAGELTAFQVRVAIGFDPPASIAPGSIIVVNKGAPVDKDKRVDMYTLDQGELKVYIDTALFLKGEIGEISSTPSPIFSSDLRRVSGEAMKQNDAPLVGKARVVQTGFGDNWEDAFKIANKWQTAFLSTPAPKIDHYRARWRDAEFRVDSMIVDSAIKLAPIWGEEQSIRTVAPVYNLKEEDVQKILKQRDKRRMSDIEMLNGSGAEFDE